MSAALIDLLPDLVFLMRRDGSVVAHMGGQGVPDFQRGGPESRNKLDQLWSPATATLIKRLLRRCIASRTPVETRFQERGRSYEVRVSPQGPNQAIGVIRAALSEASRAGDDAPDEPRWLGLDRRGFLRRLNDSLAMAALREMPIAVAVVHVEGVSQISRTMGARVSEEIMSIAMAKIAALLGKGDGSIFAQAELKNASPAASENRSVPFSNAGYAGQLRENVLAIVLNTADRGAIDSAIHQLGNELRAPIETGEVTFKLTPYAGVALSGVDSSSSEALLEHARTAAGEARRSLSNQAYFYSEAMQLRSLSRLDLGRELRDAIANRDIGFRYIGRHELATGRQVASLAYLRWSHPLRGEIPPAEFLRIAVATGLAVELSRMALELIAQDFAAQSQPWSPDMRISFGPLRDHIFHEEFVGDVERVLALNVLPPERLELRIAEKAFVARETHALRALQKRGVQLVVDEAARGMASLSTLAHAPIYGLQLDRAWVTAALSDAAANKICRATIGIANALDLAPIATGIDSRQQCEALLEMGCRYGSGDVFASI